jgi:lactoylglutathione lyase
MAAVIFWRSPAYRQRCLRRHQSGGKLTSIYQRSKWARWAEEIATLSNNELTIERVDHIGIRVTEVERAMKFYGALGFKLKYEVPYDAVVIIENDAGVEINLITNGIDTDDRGNILMDIPSKYSGYTHIALHVASLKACLSTLKANDIAITQGPVQFGDDDKASVFVRDPDRTVIELRGTTDGLGPEDGLVHYTNEQS